MLSKLRTTVLVGKALGENLDFSIGHWLIMNEAISLCSIFFTCKMGMIFVSISRLVKIK